jgi:hypothetical protein
MISVFAMLFSLCRQGRVLEGVCHRLLATNRPIRHRGERRRLRKRKNFIGSFGLAFNLNSPPRCIIRLKILYTYLKALCIKTKQEKSLAEA